MDKVLVLLRKICNEIGTPLAHAVKQLAEEGKWAQLQQLRLAPPYTYASAESYREDLLVVELLRKCEVPDASQTAARAAASEAAFFKAEAQCYRTNGYMRHLQEGHLDANDLAVLGFINRWRRIVSDILGPIPLKLNPRYSPGSTLSDNGKTITIPDKMSSSPSCYPHSQSVVLHVAAGTELARLTAPKLFRANRFFTVPKDSFIRRGCCVEASLNIASQLAAGDILRKRYNSYYKVNLHELNDRHKLIAKHISQTGSHATVDLSMASDTIATGLLKLVLPTCWFDLLDSLRAKFTHIGGRTVRLEKFSSMGNGFTFELETLLFRSLLTALGAERDEASVFGDDMIVPNRLVASAMLALRRFGFVPNERKTFSEGPFRESCGGDFYLGHDVRAVYLKKPPDEPQQWMVLHNQLKRWGGETRLRAARWFCIDQVPTDWRVFGPAHLGDVVFHSDVEAAPLGQVALAKRHSRRGLAPSTLGYWTKQPIHRTIILGHVHFKERTVVAAALMGVGEQISLRDSVIGYKNVFIPSYGLSDRDASQVFPGIYREA